jgi:hypothetical protein
MKPTMWRKLNSASVSRRCQHGSDFAYTFETQNQPCYKNASFRTKTNSDGKHGSKDLTEYKYVCVDHTYL